MESSRNSIIFDDNIFPFQWEQKKNYQKSVKNFLFSSQLSDRWKKLFNSSNTTLKQSHQLSRAHSQIFQSASQSSMKKRLSTKMLLKKKLFNTQISLEIKSEAKKIVKLLLSPEESKKLKNTMFKKKKKNNLINERAYSGKVLSDEPGNLTSSKEQSQCFGSAQERDVGIQRVKYIMEHRKYRDITPLSFDKIKSKGFNSIFNFNNSRSVIFCQEPKKTRIKKHYNQYQNEMSHFVYKKSFDEKIELRLSSSRQILQNLIKKEKKLEDSKNIIHKM